MKQRRFFLISGLILSVLMLWDARARAITLEQLVEGARKERRLEFYAPTQLTPAGSQALADAFNNMYGLNITVNYSPAGAGMVRDIGRVVGTEAAGAPADWDGMVLTDAQHATLALRKLHQAIDYKTLGVDPRTIYYGNGSVSVANQFALPAYNYKVLPAKDVPKSWEDLLAPKWKGGKLGVTVATHHLSRLAAGPWGEEKTTRYVKALAQQGLSLGTLGEIYSRLQLGEILVAVTMIDGYIHTAKLAGAPIVHAQGIEPVISPALHSGVVKGARHPNAGHLMTVFLTTPKAQEIWDKYAGESSAFIRDTRAYGYVQGKQVLYMAEKDAELVDRLAREYGRILGFTN